MRHRYILIGLLLVATAGGLATLSWTQGQPPAANNPIVPAAYVAPAQPQFDLNRMPPFTRQVHSAAHRGAEWMAAINNPVTGRFVYGWVTALNVPLEGDHLLHQAGAAFAL